DRLLVACLRELDCELAVHGLALAGRAAERTVRIGLRGRGRRPPGGVAGGERLEVADPRAEPLAGLPVQVDRHVAELGGRPDEAAVETAVQDEPAADSGA